MRPKKPKGKFAGKLVFQKGRWIVASCSTCEHYDDPCDPEAMAGHYNGTDCEEYEWNGEEGFGTHPDYSSFNREEEEVKK